MLYISIQTLQYTIRVNLPGKDGSDAKPYLEKQVKQAIEKAKNES